MESNPCQNCKYPEKSHPVDKVLFPTEGCKKFVPNPLPGIGTKNQGKKSKEEVCPYTGKKGYVKEEDCHCFCCGTHQGKKPEGCGEKFGWVLVRGKRELLICNEKQKCPECSKKNHSPQVDKDTPSGNHAKRGIKHKEGIFNLSKLYFNWNKGDVIPKDNIYFLFEDVKKFIKLLKDVLSNNEEDKFKEINMACINELAGNDLTSLDKKPKKIGILEMEPCTNLGNLHKNK